MIKTAAYFDRMEDNKVICRLCPANCRLTDGKRGICRSRYNRGGELVTDNYGELVTLAIDPIEKKPLYHFYPGTDIVSTGPNCCNLGCRHCQNWQISQKETHTEYTSPEDLVTAARRYNSIGVAFTYTEPIVWYEYIMDVAPLLREIGLKVVLVTNGYINPEPLEKLLAVTDAMNIDIKGMNPSFYKRVCKGKLEPVLQTARQSFAAGVHVEITNLIIPYENDSDEQIGQLVTFVASISETIPLHFSAYYPSYQMNHEATPAATMLRARDIAARSLKYVFLGNITVPGASDTLCPGCGRVLIERTGYRITVTGVEKGECTACGCRTGIRQ